MPRAAAPTAPRFEHRTDDGPILAVPTPTPRLSWRIPSADEGFTAAAYEIEVTPAGGKPAAYAVESGEQVLVPWPAPPIASRQAVSVRVRVRGADGEWTGWSEAAVAEGGLYAPDDWTGRFVSPRTLAGLEAPAPLLRGALAVPGEVTSARLYLTAHGLYRAQLNGRRVGDDELAPGWTSYAHRLRYRAYDVTDLVRAGDNVLDVQLGNGWHRGRLGFRGQRALYGDRVAPRLSRHRNAIYLNDDLFRRVDDLHERRDALGLSPEQKRVLERYHLAFRRSGAGRPQDVRDRLSAIGQRLATLGTQFAQNVLADEKAWALVLDGEADLAGLPGFVRDAAQRAASDRGLYGQHVVTLSRSSIEPFLQFSTRRDLREKAFRAWIARGENGATDNHAIIMETVALRAERAQLLGYPSFAHFRLSDSMAKTPEAAGALLRSVWGPARLRATIEQAALQALATGEGGNFKIEPWDWRFYSERRRKLEFDLDESELKPYLQLDRIIEAAFDTASRLFGVSFEERFDIPVYHPDVRVFEVKDRNGRHVALFFGDYFARPSKRSGAWMSSFRSQERLAGDITPIVVNVMNFSKGGEGQPSLLSFDDARTLFHEFGHGLHGMLSDVTYPLLSGTGVVRDFVEFPSQLYEHWLEEPEVLQRFARHHETGAPMPKELLDRLLASRTFNQGFATVEFISSALYDLEVHAAPGGAPIDPAAEEHRILAEIAHAGGHGDAPPSDPLPARLRRRRLFVGLLQLPVVGGPRRRRLQGLPRGGRHLRSGDGRSPQGLCLRGRQPARARGSLSGLPGPRPRRERASPQAGARRGLGRGSAPRARPHPDARLCAADPGLRGEWWPDSPQRGRSANAARPIGSNGSQRVEETGWSAPAGSSKRFTAKAPSPTSMCATAATIRKAGYSQPPFAAVKSQPFGAWTKSAPTRTGRSRTCAIRP